MLDRPSLIGMALVCTAAGIGGLTVVMTRFVIAETDPYTLASIRYLVASLFLILLVLFQGRNFRVDINDWFGIILLALVFFAAFPFCFAQSLMDTTSARGALIYACMPLVTVLLAAVFKIEKITFWKTLGVVFAIAGVWCAIGFDSNSNANSIRGDLFMALGTFFSAIYMVFAKRYVIKYDPLAMTAWSMLIGATALFFAAVFLGNPFSGSLNFSLEGWLAFLFLAIPGGTVMMWCFITGFRLVSPTQAAVSVGCNPLTAIIFGALIVGESIGWGSLAGFMLILLAIMSANRRVN
tara:strand:+ start:855 stop:1739 length:885 start_codon:yes stop_codon:yes gene_type:complete